MLGLPYSDPGPVKVEYGDTFGLEAIPAMPLQSHQGYCCLALFSIILLVSFTFSSSTMELGVSLTV